MNKKAAALLLGVGGIFIGSLVLVLLGMRTPEQRLVQIIQDGSVLYTFDLNTAENQSVRIETGDGYNIITIADGEIFISETDCPDKTCMKMGTLRSESLPIVCLPHKLVIRYEGDV